MVTNKNIIKKVHLEVETTSMDTALQIKDNIGGYFKEKIDTIISRSFEKFAHLTKNEVVRIDEIKLDLNVNSRHFYSELEAKILAGIRDKIEEISSSENGSFQFQNQEEKRVEAFLYFIEKGSLPWWGNSEEIFEEKPLIQAFNSKISLKRLQKLLKQTNTLDRLILNFDNQLITSLLSKFLDKTKSTKTHNKSTFLLLESKDSKIIFWRTLFEYIESKSKKRFYRNFNAFMQSGFSSKNDALVIPSTLSKSFIQLTEFCNQNFELGLAFQSVSGHQEKYKLEIVSSHQEAISENTKFASKMTSEEIQIVVDDDDKKTAALESPKSEIDLTEGRIVKNAGLIILYPFLQKFFENQNLLEGKNIIKDEIDLAVHLLHYLACKGEQAYEFELIMEKYLCNLPISYHINRFVSLTETQKQACDDLLLATLEHWDALKTTNIDAIRGEFLNREGKLSYKNGRETLYIERKTQDILLDKLPWNMSIIKLPWKSKVVFVDW